MSPIAGLTERRRIPRLGKIHLGMKIESTSKPGVTYPKALDFFVCPPEIKAVYGDEPKALDIMFPIDEEALIASQWYKAYSQTRGLVCKGDGVNARRLIDLATKQPEPETGVITGAIADHKAKGVEWVEGITCPGQACPYYKNRQCRELMSLQFMIPSLPGLGIWQLDTSSYNSILNINSALALIQNVFGTISGIPLILALEPLEVAPDGKKKTVWVLNIRSKETLEGLAVATRKARGILLAIAPPEEGGRPELLYPTEEEVKARAEDEKKETALKPPPQKPAPASQNPMQATQEATSATKDPRSDVQPGPTAKRDDSVPRLLAEIQANIRKYAKALHLDSPPHWAAWSMENMPGKIPSGSKLNDLTREIQEELEAKLYEATQRQKEGGQHDPT